MRATSPEAVYSLLEMALDEGRSELAVRVSYWGLMGKEQVETAMAQLREDRGLTESKPWLVYYYPAEGPTGLVEFLLDPSEELLAAELPPETEEPAEGELSPEETGEESAEMTAEEGLTEGELPETEAEMAEESGLKK